MRERTSPLRVLAKTIVFSVCVAATSPCWLLCRLQAALSQGESVFTFCSELLSLVPGLPGVYLRGGFYRMSVESFASDCHIGFGTTLAHRQVRIGLGVYVGNRCTLGKVEIEADVAIGSNVDLLSGRHQHRFDARNVPLLRQPGVFERIRIGRNCWIGNSAVIMADVAEECIVGAGSVVVKPTEAGMIVAGNPARTKRPRYSAACFEQSRETSGLARPCLQD